MQQQSRIAKVRPYTFFSAGQLVQVNSLDKIRQQSPFQNGTKDCTLSMDHKHITRAVSLGENSKSAKVHVSKNKMKAAKEPTQRDEASDDDYLVNENTLMPDEQENEKAARKGQKVKETEILICRKVHGYSWNNLWNGMSRDPSSCAACTAWSAKLFLTTAENLNPN